MAKTKHIIRLAFALAVMLCSAGNIAAQTFLPTLRAWVENYTRLDADIAKSTLNSCDVNDDERTIRIVIGGGFAEQHLTDVDVDNIYKDVKLLIPQEMRKYDMTIITDGRPIEDLVPNYYREGKKDKSRLWSESYKGKPWTRNTSRPYTLSHGLDNVHVSLWQSHGIYWKDAKKSWTWQRPSLFCTCEDLFSQTFVVPYIIPMLQNAGAVVYTPRERDYQTHEVIVDNDAPKHNGLYIESLAKSRQKKAWKTASDSAFAQRKKIYTTVDAPFSDGTARYCETSSSAKELAMAQWIPDIPESGEYAVYVTYRSYENSTTQAQYTVHHDGGETRFAVNQSIGGGTWVYLGTFSFTQGRHNTGMVTLTNNSKDKGVVSADAVRFGGGMGNVVPQSNVAEVPVSGMPRWAEGAKYSALWNGFPHSMHTEPFGNDDYSNDINTRSAVVNRLSRGSVYNSQRNDGLGVPLEVNIAFHTDAGFKRDDSFVGSLAIYRTDFNEGKTGAGLDRYVSRDLSSIILTNLHYDLEKYGWKVRQLWNRNYGEAREPMTPTCILEMLSHQNFSDVRMGYDPHFRFDFCRSVYKSIVRFVATQHGDNYVIQPLPVTDFAIQLNEKKHTAELSWAAVEDPLEPTASPQQYIIYTRIGNSGFDNGTIVKGTSASIPLQPGVLYSFRVAALNQGGESFPSETLSAGICKKNLGTALIVNGFTRLEGPKTIETDTRQGFDLDADPGVQLGAFTGFSGRQTGFNRANIGKETGDGLGVSGKELCGKIVMGNTFDYASIHGMAMLLAGHSFCSMSESAFLSHHKSAQDIKQHYPYLDVYYGVQKQFNKTTSALIDKYIAAGGRAIISGANIADRHITDKSQSTIKGCGTDFTIWREMNQYCYSVPAPSVINPSDGAFIMLQYPNGESAGIASNGNRRFVRLGFPLESITEKKKINQLINAFMAFLRQ